MVALKYCSLGLDKLLVLSPEYFLSHIVVMSQFLLTEDYRIDDGIV